MPWFPRCSPTGGEGLRQAAQLPRPDAVRAAQVPPRRRVVVAEVGAGLEALVGRGDGLPARVRVRDCLAHAAAAACPVPRSPRSPFICVRTPAPTPPLRGRRSRAEPPGATRTASSLPHPSPLVSGWQTHGGVGGRRGNICPHPCSQLRPLPSTLCLPWPAPSPQFHAPISLRSPTPPTPSSSRRSSSAPAAINHLLPIMPSLFFCQGSN